MEETQAASDERLGRWGLGPWLEEPDRIEWEHAGLPCTMLRNPLGAWCGYVGVAPGHPWHGRSYGELEHVEAHGGLTYACPSNARVGRESRPELWWVGFDCGHAGDYVPALSTIGEPDDYRDRCYVQREVELLAEQAAAALAHT